MQGLSPVTHLLVGWTVANSTSLSRRERAVVTLAGVVPDVDGLGLVADFLTRNSAHPLNWWGEYHHILAHNVGFALAVGVTAFLLSARRWTTALLALLSFHLHLLADLAGARGPEGFQWPIPYWSPFSDAWQLSWEGQWALNAWPNLLITGVLLILIFYLAWRNGFSPLEMASPMADTVFVQTLRKRFGDRGSRRL